MAAAAVLVTGPRSHFERVVPPDQSFEPGDYAGDGVDIVLSTRRSILICSNFNIVYCKSIRFTCFV